MTTDAPVPALEHLRFDVRGIPCMIIFKKGTETVRIVGASSEASLKKKIDDALQ